jgi:NitT/TauT family transport system substrate-binding protein
MMSRRIGAVTIAICLALAAVAGCSSSSHSGSKAGSSGGSSEAAAPAKVTYLFGTAAPNLADSVWFAVGQKAGFFAAQNVTVEGLNNNGSSASIQALAGGAGDVAVSELPNVIGAASTGLKIQAYSNFVHRNSNFIAVLPNSPITQVSQLAGKTIGVPSLGSGSQNSALQMLRSAGVNVSTVKFVAVGSGATVKDAMEKGTVDAVANLDLSFKTVTSQLGLTVRYLDRGTSLDSLTGALFVRRAGNSQAKNDAIDRFTRAAWESILFTITNPQKALEMTYEVFPDLKKAAAPGDVSVVSAFYAYVKPVGADTNTYQDWAVVTQSAFDSSYKFAQANKLIIGSTPVTYASLVDTSSFAAIDNFDRKAVLAEAAAK